MTVGIADFGVATRDRVMIDNDTHTLLPAHSCNFDLAQIDFASSGSIR